jgi:hypothetical protein
MYVYFTENIEHPSPGCRNTDIITGAKEDYR